MTPRILRLGEPYPDEAECVRAALNAMSPEQRDNATALALQLVTRLRNETPSMFALDALLREYPLSTAEGLALIRLAEALVRVPDAETMGRLIADKLAHGDWIAHSGLGAGTLGNASGLGLWLAQRLAGTPVAEASGNLIARFGEAIVRQATLRAMTLLGDQFVLGETIADALARAAAEPDGRYRHSFDMLGEGARSAADAERYYAVYLDALAAIGKIAAGRGPIAAPGISIKLSALHPRYEEAQRQRVLAELLPRLRRLASMARDHDIGLTIDAEESERLELSLDLIEILSADPALSGWNGLGCAVQAYNRRAVAVVDQLVALGRRHGRRLMIRLVKGAYWDGEIKRAQELGVPGYPVFTRKSHTDLAYLHCAGKLLAAPDAVYPQFATHNALTVASILELAPAGAEFEFQRLHGMGESLYRHLFAVAGDRPQRQIHCRIYAPVGRHRDLLAYLVRRLLENGANSSFVNQVADAATPLEELVADPAQLASAADCTPNPRIPSPMNLLAPHRRNAAGIDPAERRELLILEQALAGTRTPATVASITPVAAAASGEPVAVRNPARLAELVGSAVFAPATVADEVMTVARAGYEQWSLTPVETRAACLERTADALEADAPAFIDLCLREAGKTLPDAIAEVREAVDFCRYYAAEARRLLAAPTALPGPTGEANALSLHGRGVFVCISPWNFPLAIFLGQVAAALAAGNAVVAKPAEQTPLIAHRACRLLHASGIPPEALQLLLGRGGEVGSALVGHALTTGVAFTGSTATARRINRTLAARDAPIATLIAETGGQNAMIVDSTALPEQVVDAVVASSFRSAGQRCSALRVLYLQEEIADRVIEMLAGAVDALIVGDPARVDTDVGPVIDEPARARLEAHCRRMTNEARCLFERTLPPSLAGEGYFFAPRAYEIPSMKLLPEEVFGPVLHVVRFAASDLDRVIDEINASGFGLTLGIQTRIDARAEDIRRRVRVGNVYVNRNMIGAVVGVQPFGGEGGSGTGPKAGGPHYLLRFVTERCFTVNTAAAGGNASLLAG
ncbi:MAG: bifunctional proline dehydrogenase/L-glutamate gamma-semialdehyde dehydrogenase PutA [Sterolibacterium sp.]